MRYLSLFSGIEAATVAWHPLGWECVGVAEVEPFPCAVLAHHYPDVPNLGDVTRITEADIKALGHIDLVVFGSPCQDLSVAGHRKGLINADGTVTRSGLFFTAINIAHWSGARFWLWENVPGAYSSNKGRDFAAVVEFMAGMDECPVPPRGWATEGVAVGDNGLLEWACLDAQWFGVAQRRRRVFALLDTGDWAGRPPILLEPEGLRGDSAPSREKREKPPAGTGSGTAFRFLRSDNFVEDDHVGALAARDYNDARDLVVRDVSPTLTSKMQGSSGWAPYNETEHLVPVAFSSKDHGGSGNSIQDVDQGYLVPIAFHPTQDPISSTDISHAMGCGSSQGTASVAVAYGIRTANTSSNGWGVQEEVTHTLDQAQPHAVAAPVALNIYGGNKRSDRPEGGFYIKEEAATKTLDSATGLNPTCSQGGTVVIQATASMTAGVDYENNGHTVDEPTGPLLKGSPSGGGRPLPAISLSNMQVRRLTPTECERLQGFPDGYTDIPWRGKQTSPDGPRYKALGNSMAVPVMRWIGVQLSKATNDHALCL
jgi:DNA (cytosine-5)-methyltransferase 1